MAALARIPVPPEARSLFPRRLGAVDSDKAAGAAMLVEPYKDDGRKSAMVQFPGGYIAEINAVFRA